MKDTCLEVGRKMGDLSQERDRRDVTKKGPQKKGRQGTVKAASRKKVVQDRRTGAPKRKINQGRTKATPKTKVRKGRQAPLNESIYSIKDQQGQDGHLQWFPMNGNFYPKVLRIRRDGTNHSLLKRSFVWGPNGPACQVVKGLKTSEVRCKTWPSRTTCKLYCVYGHAYNEGIERTTTCHFDKNQWSKPFEECEPFVECKLKLITPGSLSCVGNEIMKSPYCKVQCDDYEDKEATSTQTYECKADGTWKPKLPHCVDVTGRTRLVKPPQKKVHIAITYP